MRRTVVTRVNEAVKALALCHNVAPVVEETPDLEVNRDGNSIPDDNVTEGNVKAVAYQASSPDEVALVRWTESVGLTLIHRNLSTLILRPPTGGPLTYTVLQIFPFTSETKRMGIIVKVSRLFILLSSTVLGGTLYGIRKCYICLFMGKFVCSVKY